MTCTEHNAEENYYLASVINVLVYLVRYGYYNDIKDVNECTKYLIVFLEGKNDCLQNCSGEYLMAYLVLQNFVNCNTLVINY